MMPLFKEPLYKRLFYCNKSVLLALDACVHHSANLNKILDTFRDGNFLSEVAVNVLTGMLPGMGGGGYPFRITCLPLVNTYKKFWR